MNRLNPYDLFTEFRQNNAEWLTPTTAEYTYQDGYQFVEYDNYIDKRVNEKVPQDDYYNGVRYLKIKLLGDLTNEQYQALDYNPDNKKTQVKIMKIMPSDLLELDLTQQELNQGYRYLKVILPFYKFKSGFLTQSEMDDGWEVSHNVFSMKTLNKRKNKRKRRNNKLREEAVKFLNS